MWFRIFFAVLLCISSGFLHAQGTDADMHRTKLPEGHYIAEEFTIEEGDTIFRKYTRYSYQMDGSDTILFVEDFNVRRSWVVSRLVVRGDEKAMSGWQQEYQVNGYLEYERFCDTISGKCERYYHYNYYPNGHVLAKLNYWRNKLDGRSLFFYNDGSLKNSLEYREGKLWNVNAYFDQQGNILDAGDFCDGNGTVNVYAASGVLLKQKIYKNGRVRKVIKMQ